jgi:predicted transcriptional regulator
MHNCVFFLSDLRGKEMIIPFLKFKPTDKAKFIKSIYRRRMALGWTQQELSSKSKVSVSLIIKLELGQRESCKWESVAKIDAALSRAEKRKQNIRGKVKRPQSINQEVA